MNKEWASVFTDTKPALFTTIKPTKILKHLEVSQAILANLYHRT